MFLADVVQIMAPNEICGALGCLVGGGIATIALGAPGAVGMGLATTPIAVGYVVSKIFFEIGCLASQRFPKFSVLCKVVALPLGILAATGTAAALVTAATGLIAGTAAVVTMGGAAILITAGAVSFLAATIFATTLIVGYNLSQNKLWYDNCG